MLKRNVMCFILHTPVDSAFVLEQMVPQQVSENHRSQTEDIKPSQRLPSELGLTELTQRRALESPVRTSQRVSMQITEKDL